MRESKKNENWKENDRVHLNGPVVNALWDWAEEGEMGECSVCSITPHKSGGLLSLPVLPLNYLSPVRTYSSSLMASSHCSSHATRHHGKSLHTCYTFPREWRNGTALRLLSASWTCKIRILCIKSLLSCWFWAERYGFNDFLKCMVAENSLTISVALPSWKPLIDLAIIAGLGSRKVMLYLSQELSSINELQCLPLICSMPGYRAWLMLGEQLAVSGFE